MGVLIVALAAFAGTTTGDTVTIPAGEFTMGRTKLTSDDKTKMRPHVLLDDLPARKVRMPAFQIDRYEVTNTKYAEFIKRPDAGRPITG